MTEEGYCRVLLDIKDTRLMELESEITKLRIEYEKQIVKLQEENAELKAQIEKMKRCFNCKYQNKFVETKCDECEDYSKWEIKEKK